MRICLVFVLTLALQGCGTATAPTAAAPTLPAPTIAPAPTVAPTLTLDVAQVKDGQPIPQELACNGANTSPLVRWQNIPPDTATLVLTVIDIDAGDYGHWGVYNIPPTQTELPANLPKKKRLDGGLMQGKTGNGGFGYEGPCPPFNETHRYVFTLYALSEPMEFPANMEKFGVPVVGFETYVEGKIIASASVTGTYQRQQP